MSPSKGRYLWLAFLLGVLLLGSNWPLLLTPYTLLSHEIDRAWTGQFPWLAIAALLLGLLFYPRFWCVFICPTGLLLSAISHWRLWRQSSAAGCNQCGRCRLDCPAQSARPGQSAGEQCLLCGRCQDGCPSKAVRWIAGRRIHPSKEIPSTAAETGCSDFGQSRRMLLKGAAATIAVTGLWFWLGRRAMAQPLRPPGALPEPEFLERCARCARCIKVCPNQALQPAPLSAGLSTMETPQLAPRKGRCDLCLLCQEVCPTGAIRRLPAGKVKIGTAILDQASCLAWQQGKYCLLCVEQCTFQAVRMDEKRRPFVRAASCIGCGACENGCLVAGAAIHVYP
ncbi:MAG: 4Fe-4S dicluster domain-containing protein [Thermacetogeniaceae bacterium]